MKLEFDHTNIKELQKVAVAFSKKQNIDTILVTLSELGIYTHSKKSKTLIPAHIRDISDVSGAGDTVISVAALCLAQKLPPVLTATLANLAGGLVCETVGIAPINKKKLLDEAIRLNL